jgi:hypothetical protein
MEEKEEVRHSVLALHGIFFCTEMSVFVFTPGAVREFGRGYYLHAAGFSFWRQGPGKPLRYVAG